jgi:hypothetical protein
MFCPSKNKRARILLIYLIKTLPYPALGTANFQIAFSELTISKNILEKGFSLV